jgi:hypothetical protein
VWWKVCVTKKQIFLPKNVLGGAGYNSRSPGCLTRPLPSGHYRFIKLIVNTRIYSDIGHIHIYQKVYGQGGVDAMALRLQDKRASTLPTHLLVVWWWKPEHLLMRYNMGKNKWFSHKLYIAQHKLCMASHKFVWQPVTQIFCVVFCAIFVNSTQTFN